MAEVHVLTSHDKQDSCIHKYRARRLESRRGNTGVWTSADSGKVQWLVPDHLGTPRIILDETGNLAGVRRHDYLPFGEELFAGTGGRTAAMGYAADGVRQQFTSKERDTETGFDYFGARYYSSIQGRFTSPDEFTGGPTALHSFTAAASSNPTIYADVTNPQSLNKYQYTFGNPLAYVDPDGHNPCCVTDEDFQAMTNGGKDVAIGALKAAANLGISTANFSKAFLGGTPDEPYLPTNKTQGVSMIVVEKATFFVGLLTGRANVGGVAIAESQTTAAASTRALATRTANQAQSLRPRPGAAGAATAVTGETYTATAGRTQLNPAIQQLLDSVPISQRSPYHGACCEPNLLSQMVDNGVNPKGASISVMRVRPAGNPQHANTDGTL